MLLKIEIYFAIPVNIIFEISLTQVFFPVMSFPTKEERTKCWSARDQYWECLDKNSVKSGDTKDINVCAEFRKMYEQSCSAQWVKHFDRKRNYLIFKEKIEKDGYEPLESVK